MINIKITKFRNPTNTHEFLIFNILLHIKTGPKVIKIFFFSSDYEYDEEYIYSDANAQESHDTTGLYLIKKKLRSIEKQLPHNHI